MMFTLFPFIAIKSILLNKYYEMKIIQITLLILLIASSSYSRNNFNYLDPSPDAKYVNIKNNIIIGFDKQINLSENEIARYITVTGSTSKLHNGTVLLSNENRKIIYKISAPFELKEKVTVKINKNLMKIISGTNEDYSYCFYTSSIKTVENPVIPKKEINTDYKLVQGNSGGDFAFPPMMNITVNNNPSEGYIFLCPFTYETYLITYDINGNPYWYTNIEFGGDFKLQSNGYRTYFDGAELKHYEINDGGAKIDSFYCGNGYVTDIHELRVLSNGYALVMAYDTEVVNMSQVIQGGDTAANVVGTIYQEIDADKNVVFQWRSWDHFNITDALHENLLAHNIDAVHGNAIELDNDGNLIVSSRHLDEITKINIISGEIMWRFGGLHNQFTYLNDSITFHYQHAVRRLPNGNITIYDNGNFHTPHYSRAAEYHLDEVNKTAELVWQYVPNPIIFGTWGGYVQRLENGNTLISWGGANTTITEVTPGHNVVFQGAFLQGVYTYRGYKFPISGLPTQAGNDPSVTPESFSLGQNYPNPFNPSTKFEYNIAKASFVEISIFDITGKELKKLVTEYEQPGKYTISFDGSRLSSGIYIYRLKAGDFMSSKKMILMK